MITSVYAFGSVIMALIKPAIARVAIAGEIPSSAQAASSGQVFFLE